VLPAGVPGRLEGPLGQEPKCSSASARSAHDDLILDIPMNVVTEVGGKYVANK